MVVIALLLAAVLGAGSIGLVVMARATHKVSYAAGGALASCLVAICSFPAWAMTLSGRDGYGNPASDPTVTLIVVVEAFLLLVAWGMLARNLLLRRSRRPPST